MVTLRAPLLLPHHLHERINNHMTCPHLNIWNGHTAVPPSPPSHPPWPLTWRRPIFGMPQNYIPDFIWLYNLMWTLLCVPVWIMSSLARRRPRNQARIGKQESRPWWNLIIFVTIVCNHACLLIPVIATLMRWMSVLSPLAKVYGLEKFSMQRPIGY